MPITHFQGLVPRAGVEKLRALLFGAAFRVRQGSGSIFTMQPQNELILLMLRILHELSIL